MEEKIQIQTKDNVLLAGLLLEAINPKAIVQLNSATAVAKEFYINFAKYLVEQQFTVFIYDYRGIGESIPAKGLRGCTYNYTDWAQYDMAAAIDYLKSRFSKLPLLIMSHSVGGQLLGFIPNANEHVKAVVTVNTSAGHGGNMKLKFKLRNWYFFEIVRPISLLLFGYGKLKFLGIMEDLPKNILNQFRDWCSVPEYFFNPKFGNNLKGIEGFKNLAYPVDVYTASDDEIATPANLENFWKHVSSKVYIKHHRLVPSDFGLKYIGHFDLFRKKNKEKLWPILINNLQKHLTQ